MSATDKMYVDAMQQIMKHTPHIDVKEVLNAQVQYFYDKLVKPIDQALMTLAWDKNLSQAKLDAFLKDFDIECVGGDKALLLSYVMKAHPDLKFDTYNGPRLAGLLKFHRFANLDLIAHYTKIGKELNKKGVVPLIMKGGAMKFLRPDLPRAMGDIDILVKRGEDFKKAMQVATDMGFDMDDNGHSVDLHEKGSEAGLLDIHQWVDMRSDYNVKFMDEIFERAEKKKVFGVETYVPCAEDMVFLGLVNMVKNIREKTSLKGILYTLFDFEFLTHSKPDFDWKIIVEDIKKTNTYPQMYTAMLFANKIVAGLISSDLLEDAKIMKVVRDYCNRDIYYSVYVHDLKLKCKTLRLIKSLKDWKSFEYWYKTRIPYFFLKRIGKSQTLTNLFLKYFH
ncbi:MAG TPA: hypothetical protein DIC64_00665 [Alphaproteobacteria bacterium]|nr:hypothetical protein [Alphaproteobacteria bacterium]